MCSRRGVRADRGAGFANGFGGMVTRGESGTPFAVLAALENDAALWSVDVVLVDVTESYDVFRDNAG